MAQRRRMDSAGASARRRGIATSGIEAIKLNQSELRLDAPAAIRPLLKLRCPSGSAKLKAAPAAKPLRVSYAKATEQNVSGPHRIDHRRNPDHHDRNDDEGACHAP